MKLIKFLTIIFLLVFILVTSFASIVYIYEQRHNIALFFSRFVSEGTYKATDSVHRDFAMEIMKGGYILHFRHAERDKWIDVVMYDSLESDVHANGINETRYAENDYFKDAVCLNERGFVQAEAMREHLNNIKFPFSYVISSPSCRSRQTADIVFGGYERLDRKLVHRGPYDENYKNHVSNLKSLYLELPITEKTNTIISSHNGVLHREMFDEMNPKVNFDLGLEEGGFFVISSNDGKLSLLHGFHNFKDFIKYFYPR